jgi:hypothetical protein
MKLDPELEQLVSQVLSFAREVNEWEVRMNARSRLDAGQYVRNRAAAAEVSDRTYDEVLAEHQTIRDRFCTDRVRRHTDGSWSATGRFVGASRESVLSAKITQPNRSEICVRCGQFPDQKHKFVLFKRRGQWRIDNILSGSGDSEEWQRSLL